MDMHGRQKEAKAQHSGLRPKQPHTNPCSWAAWHMSNKSTKPGLTNWVHSRFTAILLMLFKVCTKSIQKHLFFQGREPRYPKKPKDVSCHAESRFSSESCCFRVKVAKLFNTPASAWKVIVKICKVAWQSQKRSYKSGTALYACIIEV